MQKDNKLYWKAFTSSCLDLSDAVHFGKFTYIILLDTANPHPFMIVAEEFSMFKEEEIILFPYFYFECSAVSCFTGGERYECKQVPLEEE
jgi:hypothetical protein